jgi:hypothetical protein
MAPTESPEHETANDRFKRGFSSWLWVALILATAAHFLLFRASPDFRIQDITFGVGNVEVVEIPDKIDIPAPPASIPRPATPVIAEVRMETDITIAPSEGRG